MGDNKEEDETVANNRHMLHMRRDRAKFDEEGHQTRGNLFFDCVGLCEGGLNFDG
jgi:hypothetical protein